MSYKSALIAAGAEVLNFEYFGSYSGQWFAKVRYNGETGWIQDWYGSCTYCDAFQSEFEGINGDAMTEEEYNNNLVAFGKRYLNNILPADHYLPKLDEDAEYDDDAERAAEWIRKIEGL